MTDFIGKDRRGNTLLLTQKAWDHAVRRGHFTKMKGTWKTVMDAFTNSTIVLDNPELEGSREFGPERKAQERYISYVEEWSEYLIVPVVVSEKAVTPRIGAQQIDPPVRIATSAYPSPEIPTGAILWQVSTEDLSK